MHSLELHNDTMKLEVFVTTILYTIGEEIKAHKCHMTAQAWSLDFNLRKAVTKSASLAPPPSLTYFPIFS